jgi:molybdopterin molybdotransferase
MIAFEVFARPAILKMMGKRNFTKPSIEAVMDDPIKNVDGRRIFARVVVSTREGRYFAHLTGPQGSGILASMVKADGLAVIPETIREVKPGDTVEVMMLDWDEAQD